MPLTAHAGVPRRQYYCRVQAAIPAGLRLRRCERRSSIFSSSEQTCTTSDGAGLKRRIITRRGRAEERLSRSPEDSVWSEVAKRYMTYSEKVGTPELLTSLALGKISSCPFPPEEIDALKQGVISFLQTKGLLLGRNHEDRRDVPIDVRYLSLLLQAAQVPETALGDFSRGVRVGRSDSHDYRRFIRKEEVEVTGSRRPLRVPGRRDRWRSHVETELLVDCRALDVLNDQSSKGQILNLPEAEARLQFTHLVVASLGAQRKNPGGYQRTSVVRRVERHTGKSAYSSSRPGARACGL